MGKSRIWLLLVDLNFRAVGNRFPVTIDDNDYCVHYLKEAVEKLKPAKFTDSNPRIYCDSLIVWRTKGKLVINSTTRKNLKRTLKKINIRDKKTIEEVHEHKLVADLQLTDNETLLVRLPYEDPDVVVDSDGDEDDSDGDDDNSDGDEDDLDGEVAPSCPLPGHEGILPKANTGGVITKEDLTLNQISEASTSPKFVLDVEARLSQRRMLNNRDTYEAATHLIGTASTPETLGVYLDLDDNSRRTGAPLVDVDERVEVHHLFHLSAISGVMGDEYRRPQFTEADANYLFFYLFGWHLRMKNLKFTVKFGSEPWPFQLTIQVKREDATGHDYFSYKPRSDFLVLMDSLPRMVVNSQSSDRPPSDHYHMMVQGAFVVRFANKFLDAYKHKKDFFFVTIFIGSDGKAQRRILYQKRGSNVYYRERTFQIFQTKDRMQFTLELYNLASILHSEGDNSGLKKHFDELNRVTDSKLLAFYPGGGMEQLELEANGDNVVLSQRQ